MFFVVKEMIINYFGALNDGIFRLEVNSFPVVTLVASLSLQKTSVAADLLL